MSVKDKLTHHLLSKQVIFSGFVLLILAVFGVFANSVFADNPSSVNGQRLVTIHDQGSSVTIVTRSSTVAEALSQADIVVGKQDIVEPAMTDKLVAKAYHINVFRARPVIVVLGDKQSKVMTAEQSPRQIAEAAGFKFYDEDKARFERVDSVLSSDGIGIKMIIEPATAFNLTLFGSHSEVRTQGRTVGEMLDEKDIKLSEDDKVSPDTKHALTAGLEVKVWREGVQTVTVDEVVAKPIEEVKDRDHEKGWREVKIVGKDGQRRVTYEIVIQDGVEVSRKEIASVVTVAPVKQVVVVGVKTLVAPYTGGGNKDEWLAASGIPREEWGYVDSIVQRESGWNPNAINKSSGACGLAQALPCSKVPGNPYNPVDSLRWMNAYVNGRYYDGSPYTRGVCSGITSRWACAYTFWNVYHWY